jgi:hypothetical protein
MLANRKDEGFRATNGELTTVRGVDRDGIHLDDGRSIPSNYREFTHGYAVTAHRSQGKTVDSVIISADVMKQELFYVSASRGREDIAILTSDVNRLGEFLGGKRNCSFKTAECRSHAKSVNRGATIPVGNHFGAWIRTQHVTAMKPAIIPALQEPYSNINSMYCMI